MSSKTRVGIIGCGKISDAYFGTNAAFSFFDIVACADLNPEAARAKAQQWNIPRACPVEELLDDESIGFVVNLTIPRAHGPVILDCLRRGKSVYTEKPLTVTREEARQTLTLAAESGLRVGSAPDTFLGGAHQTCRALIDQGAIGEPLAAAAFMACHGHEHWHPSPEFYYQPGGGPMFDMGPYYLTNLIQLLGPVESVAGFTRKSFAQRTITSAARQGTVIDVEVPTHVAGTLKFSGGVLATMIMSFDVWGHGLPPIEIYGTEGTLYVPDPNGFGGPVKIRRGRGEIEAVPLTHGYTENARGIGMADMILAMQNGRDHRCNERVAYHVLDVMHAFHDASDQRAVVDLASSCERPAALPAGLRDGQLEP